MSEKRARYDRTCANLIGGDVSIRVLNNYVLVQPDDIAKTTKLAIPDAAREAQFNMPKEGLVVAVGPGMLLPTGQRAPLSVSVGDQVLLDGRMCKPFKDKRTERFYVICTEDAILGVRE